METLTKRKKIHKTVTQTEVSDAFSKFYNPDPSPKTSPFVTLIRPPIIFSASSYSVPVVPPLGIVYLAGTLEKAGYRVKIIDCPGLAINNIQLVDEGQFKVQGLDIEKSIQLIDKDTDIFGVTTMFSQEWPFIRGYINKLRVAFPKAKIIIGGEHVTALSEFSLRDCQDIDYIVKGEGELALLELVHNLRNGKPISEIPGVVYLENNQYVESKAGQRLANIDQLPWPAWHDVDLEPYFRPNFTMGIAQGRNMPILGTRGCPYQCTFCSNPLMWTTRYVMRPIDDVINEIEYYMKTYKANSFDFFDLTAIIKKDWIMDFTNELERRNLNITWQLPSGTRSEVIDEEVVSKLASTNLKFLVYAPESGSKRTLKDIKKKVKLDKMTQSITAAKKYGIIVKTNIIIGFPNETRTDIWKTLWLILKFAFLKVDDCNIAMFSPYPGSEIFRELRRNGTIPDTDDRYFSNLMTQYDILISKTFCKNLHGLELFIYRILGMGGFYFLSYLRAPSKFFRVIKLLTSNVQFVPNSLFEQRIFDYAARKNIQKTVNN